MPENLLTPDELEAIDLTAQLANALSRVVAEGSTRNHDLNELLTSVHAIQHAVMAQTAGRAYPDRFRLLGGTLSSVTASAAEEGT